VFKSNPSSVTNLKIEAARFDETSVIYLKIGIFISTAVRMSVSKAASQNEMSALRVRCHSSCRCYHELNILTSAISNFTLDGTSYRHSRVADRSSEIGQDWREELAGFK
jgi:antitoxin component of RelBE/YafQ-DinJ toxin-antitoxin module